MTERNIRKKFQGFRVFGLIFANFRVFRATKMNSGLFRVSGATRYPVVPVPVDLSKLSDIVKMLLLKKMYIMLK